MQLSLTACLHVSVAAFVAACIIMHVVCSKKHAVKRVHMVCACMKVIDTGSVLTVTDTGSVLTVIDTGSVLPIIDTGNVLPVIDTGSVLTVSILTHAHRFTKTSTCRRFHREILTRSFFYKGGMRGGYWGGWGEEGGWG